MCNIIILKPGQMPIRDEFDNMCYNNWHAFGLVTLVDGKMDITKKAFTDKDEINPQVIWDLLQRDIQYDRFLHVRHMTAGTNDIENAHPFDVFYNAKRRVVFMHNGTLYQYRSKKKNEHGVLMDDDSGPSDTKNFVDQILTPYLTAMDFGKGHGDIQNEYIWKLLEAFWNGSNRGLLISSDQGFVTLGAWKKRSDSAGGEYKTANDDYFKVVSRGPELTRREASRKAAEEAKKYNPQTAKNHSSTALVPVTPMQNYPNLGKPVNGFFTVKDSFKNILSDWSIYDREHAVTVGALTQEELKKIISLGDDGVFLMDLVFTDYAAMYGEMLELEAKHDRASKLIATLRGEIALANATEVKAA